jgi:RNA polymerase sigma-70 factor (ECF subfamily)
MQDEVFTQLVDTYHAALYRFALSLARNSADASDLTQQTFYVWATKGSALRDLSKAKTWLFTTLYREFLRTRRRGQRLTAIEDLPPGEQDVPDELAADQVDKLDGELVLAALQELDEAFRAPLTLFYLQDLSYAEIAETLDVPIGTVMSRLSRGKTQLRALLAGRERGAQVIAFPSAQRKTS